ncbi:MAG: glucosamine-6-phosphate deaminase [Acidobacteria bacterium]|nr:glucosamine-6-phosphate deaminase [Acidobacteriota bacterium]
MRLRVFSSSATLARALAADVARALATNPRLVLGLPAGRTPIPLYDALARLYQAGRVDFRRAAAFNLDEFIGLGARHPGSYRAFMRQHLLDRINLPPANVHAPRGEARDVARECARYERAIARMGGIDLQILGLGVNGHVGFNEPASALIARTHRARLRLATRRANASLFGGRVSAVPREAVSMGMATILKARRLVLIATGAAKARALQRLIEGPVTTRLPASLLPLHPRAEVWVDRDAASRLRGAGANALRRPRQSRRARSRARRAAARARGRR